MRSVPFVMLVRLSGGRTVRPDSKESPFCSCLSLPLRRLDGSRDSVASHWPGL